VDDVDHGGLRRFSAIRGMRQSGAFCARISGEDAESSAFQRSLSHWNSLNKAMTPIFPPVLKTAHRFALQSQTISDSPMLAMGATCKKCHGFPLENLLKADPPAAGMNWAVARKI